MASLPQIERVAMLSVHTSPLEQPGTGDAGGLNVYVAEVSKQLARRGIEVEIFTRRTAGDQPVQSELVPGAKVRRPNRRRSSSPTSGVMSACNFSMSTLGVGR